MLTSDLVTSIQRRAAIPVAQVTFSMSDFYSLIDEETASKVIPLVLSNIEEYYVSDSLFNITSGQNTYVIPPRAIAGKLRDVQLISSTNSESIFSLERLDSSDLFASTSTSYRYLIQKSGYYIKNNSVILYPGPQITQNILNLEHYRRPSACVDPSTCAVITAISGSTITVSSLPSNITTATLVDFVKVNSGFECTAIDQTVSSISGSILTMAVTPPSTLAVGDYVCQAKQTCVVQVPQELLPLLAQYVVVRVLSAQGDLQALQSAQGELKELERNALMLIAPRVNSKPKRAVNTRGVSRFV